MKLLVLLTFAFAAVGAFRYDGYRLIEVKPLHDLQRTKLVAELADNDERIKQVILMNEHVVASEAVVLAVAPIAYNRVVAYLRRKGMDFDITNTDLQKTYDEEKAANEMALKKWRKAGSKAAPTAYLPYDEQIAWLESAAAASTIAETFGLGSTYEEQEMRGIRINHGNGNLPGIWLDANIHAREWLTSASMLYIIDQILTGTSVDAVEMRNNYRWYIVPNANPDGYRFSWDTDRMWRKTRSPNSGSQCYGTDPNRNWDENWGGAGSSNSPCTDDYRGPSVFSEVEVRNLRDHMTAVAGFTNVMITVHAYSQYWLIPWGGYSYKPADYNELKRVGDLAAAAIRNTNGLVFLVGTPPDLLYVAPGGSFDWTKAKLNMVYSYAPEVRPLNAAQGGFDVPPSNITPSGAEVFAAIVATARNAVHKI